MKNPITYLIILVLMLSSCNVKEQENINIEASVTALGNLPENPLLLTPMTSLINRKESTMSVVYGNELAVKYAEANNGNTYPIGAILYKVTWQAKPDALWFGAKIPGKIKLIERVSFSDKAVPYYKAYEGEKFEEKSVSREAAALKAGNITSIKMAVSP